MQMTSKMRSIFVGVLSVFGSISLGSSYDGNIAKATHAGAATCSAQGFERCQNCEAYVIVDSRSAQKFAAQFVAISSMPLCGEVVGKLPRGKARVRVVLAKDYATQNHLNSFDVAKKISEMGTDGGVYKVHAITAMISAPRG